MMAANAWDFPVAANAQLVNIEQRSKWVAIYQNLSVKYFRVYEQYLLDPAVNQFSLDLAYFELTGRSIKPMIHTPEREVLQLLDRIDRSLFSATVFSMDEQNRLNQKAINVEPGYPNLIRIQLPEVPLGPTPAPNVIIVETGVGVVRTLSVTINVALAANARVGSITLASTILSPIANANFIFNGNETGFFNNTFEIQSRNPLAVGTYNLNVIVYVDLPSVVNSPNLIRGLTFATQRGITVWRNKFDNIHVLAYRRYTYLLGLRTPAMAHIIYDEQTALKLLWNELRLLDGIGALGATHFGS